MEAASSDTTPVIAVDGPNAAGKGTVCGVLARRLRWHLLDSGALYRLVALGALAAPVEHENTAGLVALARSMIFNFEPDGDTEPARVLLSGKDVTAALRTERCGALASRIAVIPALREALLARQRAFATPPGLVADGRDMGTVVFPLAPLKIFLTASPDERALRRYKQLRQKGIDVNLAALSTEIAERDRRDRERATAPLRPAVDAVEIDTSALSIVGVIDRVLELVEARGLAT